MSEIRVNKVIDEAGTGQVELTQGATLPTGKILAGAGSIQVTGGITGNVTGNVSGSSGSCTGNSLTATNASGLSGTPNIAVNNIVGVAATFTGAVSIGGTLTYEDVNNIDSVGLVTARTGLQVLAGVTSMTGGVRFNGGGSLREKVKVTAGKLSDNLNIDLENGMVHLFTTAETATSTPNIRVSASKTLNSELAVGEQISVSVITTAAAAAFSANWTIDGAAVTEVWNGAAAPAAGGASGKDFYTLNIIKTSSTPDYTVLCNVSNFA
tara:strand:+ start:551 stop:1351 length:801 start_codon:yes stop_codon:yes gene_type:complete